VEIISIIRADAFGGFDFNDDKKFAPGRAFKGGKNAYLELDGERVDLPNMWACLIDVAACMNLKWWAPLANVNYIEAITLVHLHELSHACDDGKSERYDYGGYSHTHYWNEVLVPLSRLETKKRTKEKIE